MIISPDRRKALEGLFELYSDWERSENSARPSWPEDFRCPTDCSHCCNRTPVLPVTAIEAVAAAAAFETLSPDIQGRIREAIARTAALISDDRRREPFGHDKAACPLLENGKCSIYAARPLFCRAYGFGADDGAYFGCEILFPRLQKAGDFELPSLDAARMRVPQEVVLDRSGQQLPDLGPLAEMLDRLLPPISTR